METKNATLGPRGPEHFPQSHSINIGNKQKLIRNHNLVELFFSQKENYFLALKLAYQA